MELRHYGQDISLNMCMPIDYALWLLAYSNLQLQLFPSCKKMHKIETVTFQDIAISHDFAFTFYELLKILHSVYF